MTSSLFSSDLGAHHTNVQPPLLRGRETAAGVFWRIPKQMLSSEDGAEDEESIDKSVAGGS